MTLLRPRSREFLRRITHPFWSMGGELLGSVIRRSSRRSRGSLRGFGRWWWGRCGRRYWRVIGRRFRWRGRRGRLLGRVAAGRGARRSAESAGGGTSSTTSRLPSARSRAKRKPGPPPRRQDPPATTLRHSPGGRGPGQRIGLQVQQADVRWQRLRRGGTEEIRKGEQGRHGREQRSGCARHRGPPHPNAAHPNPSRVGGGLSPRRPPRAAPRCPEAGRRPSRPGCANR